MSYLLYGKDGSEILTELNRQMAIITNLYTHHMVSYLTTQPRPVINCYVSNNTIKIFN